MCLVHLLLAWNKAPIHIVHVDHGWRRESTTECEQLKSLAEDLGLAFHTTSLNPACYSGNKEAESRKERYSFFCKVAKEVNAQGIVLGHHKDDQCETVFKRVLEGASLEALSGIKPVGQIDGLCILRPLLSVAKADILEWLNSKNIAYFTDPTNLQTHFLRGRLRTQIFPYLQEHFGKAFQDSLFSIGEEAQELTSYLDLQCAPYIQKALHGPWGVYFAELPASACEIKHIIRSMPLTLSRQQLRLVVAFLQEGVANKQVMTNNGILYIDRARAFFVQSPIEDVQGTLDILEGSFLFGNWHVTASVTNEVEPAKNSLRNVWEGNLSTYLPLGQYRLLKSTANMRRHAKEYSNWLGEKKIPHFIASKVPVVCKGNEIVEDFLTGCACPQQNRPYLHLKLVCKRAK